MKISHIAIWAEDLDGLCEFYVTYFGAIGSAKYHNPRRDFTSCFLSFESGGNESSGDGETRIEMMHIPDMEAPASRGNLKGLAHIAISVGSREAVDALTERLRADGHTITSEPRTTGDGYYESVALDPEGNVVEIVA
ncbi:MAG: VOC family protein [Alistipes sp.]|jgi:lactoylglutathione lyase|nr:VOC family protein [Alistipes sp.]